MSAPQPRRAGAPKHIDSPARRVAVSTICALMLREISMTHGRSAGGYLWAVMEPTLGIALLVGVFSIGFHAPPLGHSFPIFYATGLLPFFMFANVENRVGNAMAFSRLPLAYPCVHLLDAILARFILAVLTQFTISLVIFGALVTFLDVRARIDLPMIVSSFAMAGTLGLGVGAINLLLSALYPVWQRIWGIINRPLILLSGVIFLHDRIPQPYQDWLWWNPLVHITAQSRAGFYHTYRADYISEAYVYALALGMFVTAMLFLGRYYRDFMEH